MKIIQFISNLGKGGAERLVTDMCNEFALQKGVEIILITYNQDKKSISFINELSKSVKHIDLKKKYKIDLLLQLKVFKFLLTEKPDVVHSHLSGTLIYLYLPILIIKKIKFYHTVHNIADEELKGDFLIFLRKLVLKTQKLNTISII